MSENLGDDLHAWQIAAIEQGLRDADAGRVVTQERVVAWVLSWDSPNEPPMPKPIRSPGESRDPSSRVPSA
jgi:predicted transcriptional regulator